MQKLRKAGIEQTLSERAFVAVAEMFGLSDPDYPLPGSIWGCDLSHWTGIVPDWSVVKASGCRFVIIKAMHGKNLTNCFKENYAGAVSVGMPVSLYHWLCPAAMVSPGGQARAYADLCKQYPPTMRDVWTDFEWTPYTYKEGGHSVTVTTELDDLESFMSVWNAEYGKPIGIYSSPSYWQEHGSTNPKWLQYPLWIANYRVTSPYIPAPFIRELFWQWSESGDGDMIGTAPGERRVDLNAFNGDENKWQEYLNGTEIPPVDPPGEPMNYKVTVNPTASGEPNIREIGGASLGKDIGNFHKGQVGLGTEVLGSPTGQYYCLHVTSGADVEGWIYSRWNNASTYAAIEEITEPPVITYDTVTINVIDNKTGKAGTATIELK